ncbi:hypothetical protein [Undibacterium flavidum]|uniref:Uncharacterized protein n=1 Tax=Undibacterium flavidum TaxID=2762297 RepID=A0ABR6Y987_9BURK|nr:hypothetical protein [Undibacterium flavidum]MBC3873192.1 hypothetical protein [Undibacterium flavidum]
MTRKSGLSLSLIAWIFLLFVPVAYWLSNLVNSPVFIAERDLIPMSVQLLQPPEIIVPVRGGDRSPYLRLSLRDTDSLQLGDVMPVQVQAQVQAQVQGTVRGWDFLQKETTQVQLLALHENQQLVIFVAAENQHNDLRRIWKIQKDGQVILDLNETQRAERLLAEYKQESANVMILFFALLGAGLLSIAGLRKLRRIPVNGNSDFAG